MNEKNLQAKAIHVRLLGTCTPWAQGKPFCDNEFARVIDLPGLGVLFEINFSCSGSKHVLLNVDVCVIIRDHLVSIWQLAAVTLARSVTFCFFVNLLPDFKELFAVHLVHVELFQKAAEWGEGRSQAW